MKKFFIRGQTSRGGDHRRFSVEEVPFYFKNFKNNFKSI
nr:MAG TPA: hypothetical protein [Caudoviricetes sp.]